MESRLFNQFDLYFFPILGFHTLISFVIALLLSRYVKKRFITSSYKVNKKDLSRLQGILDESKLYK
ncbi:MAG: hypothetical protein ACP5D3_07245, partial [Sulfurovum sp.]